MSLDNIIKVTIDRNTTNPTRAGFGTPLVAASATHTTRQYTAVQR